MGHQLLIAHISRTQACSDCISCAVTYGCACLWKSYEEELTVCIPVAELYPMWGTGLRVAFPYFNVPESVVTAAYASDTKYLSPSFLVLPRSLSLLFTLKRIDFFFLFDNFFPLAIFRLQSHLFSL